MSESTLAPTRFRATIQYDGTGFHGSQLQPRVRTVQGEIETALGRLLDGPTRIDLAGRTDTGVHALAQEIAFEAPARWSAEDLGRGLSALLPSDVALELPREAAPDFHPRFAARRRRYEYMIAMLDMARSPFVRTYAWRLDAGTRMSEEDLDGLDDLAALIVGERSFRSFARSGQPERGARCLVESARWTCYPGGWLSFRITADRFLHHMVRYLVGTMVEVATRRRPAADVGALLAGEPATRAVFPAPPHGLYLTGVEYEDGWNRPAGVPWLGGGSAE